MRIMKIILQNPFEDIDTSLLQSVADACAEAEGLDKNLCVQLHLCTDAEIEEINRLYRNIDKPTDVLSFPSMEFKQGTLHNNQQLLGEVYDDVENAYFIGDSFISVARAQEQAALYGHSFQRELAFLFVHSILHLFGYDHVMETDEQIMRQKQKEVLTMLNITRNQTD